MKLENYHFLEYLDYWPHLYYYTHNVSVDTSSAFFRCFMLNSGVHTESQTESFIWITGVDFSSSFNQDRVQGLSYSKYSLLVLLVVGIEPVTSKWFHSEAPSNQTPYPLRHVYLLDNQSDSVVYQKEIKSLRDNFHRNNYTESIVQIF